MKTLLTIGGIIKECVKVIRFTNAIIIIYSRHNSFIIFTIGGKFYYIVSKIIISTSIAIGGKDRRYIKRERHLTCLSLF